MKRTTALVVAVFFPLALLAYPLSIVLPVERVEIENRALEPPDLNPESLLAIDTYRDALSYVRSASPLRTLLIRGAAGLDFRVFGDSPDPRRVLKGNDGWLYFSPTMSNPCAHPPEIVAANLIDFVMRLSEDVPIVVLTIAPSKFIVYPEYLTSEQARFASCGLEASGQLRAILEDAPIQHYVDGWALFESLKASGQQTYFATDTHFNFEGSIPWMEALIDEIAPIWNPDDVVRPGPTFWLGNLTRFIGLEEPEEVAHAVVQRAVTARVTEDANGVVRYEHRGDVPLIAGKTVLLGDSFIDLPEPSLVQYFADVTLMDWRDDSLDVFVFEAKRSDVVVIEVSELDVWWRFATSRLLERYESAP